MADKKRRHGKSAVPVAKSTMQAKRERKEIRRFITAATIFFSIVILAVAVVVFLNSGLFYKHATAVSINGRSFSIAEFNFHYYNYYYRYINAAKNYQGESSLPLPANGTAFERQTTGGGSGETWKDYFESAATEELSRYVRVNMDAAENGFVLHGDKLAEYEAALADYRAQAENSSMSINEYLSRMFGPGVDLSVLTECLRFIYTADAFVEEYRNTITIPESDLLLHHESNYAYYRNYNYMYFLVKADLPDRKDYKTDDQFDAALETALDSARERAEAISSGIRTDKDMEAAARQYDPEQYGDPLSTYRSYEGLLLGKTYGDWLMSPSRRNGDMHVAGINTGYYVIRYLSSSDNDFPTADIRVIRINSEAIDKTKYADDEAYNKACNDSIAEAERKAESVFSELEDSGKTETVFADLSKRYSDRLEQEADPGGVFTNTCPREFPSEVDEWCFDPARKPGDCGLLYSGTDKAYYIVYYVAPGSPYSLVLAENDMRDTAYNTWYSSLGTQADIHKTLFYPRAMNHIPQT